MGETSVHEKGGKNPKWNQTIEVEIDDPKEPLQLTVFEKDLTSDDLVGEAFVPMADLLGNNFNG